MRETKDTPSLVPKSETIYLILDDCGQFGRVYRETDLAKADFETVIDDLLHGQCDKPMRVVAFNTADSWSCDVSEDIAWELVKRASAAGDLLPNATRDFVEFHIGERERANI